MVDPSLAARYGLKRPRAGTAPAGAPAAAAPAAAPEKLPTIEGFASKEGTWSRNNGSYILKGSADPSETEANINEETGRLSWVEGKGNFKITLFFVRAG